MVAKILIVDSAPAAAQAALAQHGGASYAGNYAAALRSRAEGAVDGLDIFVLSAGDGESLPQGMAFADFHGIVWTGSPLTAYDGTPLVQHQIDIARGAFASGAPGFGSCWGMQVMSAALGGEVRPHATASEFGVARHIRLNEAGRDHPMFAGKPATFDALCWHQDEVCVPPPGAIVLAGNDHSAIQALVCDDGACSFWGVQYHPEFGLSHMAALFRRGAGRLARDGLLPHRDDAEALAGDFQTLQSDPARKDIAWRYGLGADVTDPACHQAELANWLRVKVAPRAASA